MENEHQGFFYIIPAFIAEDVKLSDATKLFYGLLSSLCKKEGYCFANNAYLAEKTGKSIRQIQRMISQLYSRGHVVPAKDEDGQNRQIFLHDPVTKMSPPHDKNVTPPHDKNVIHSSIGISSTSSSLKETYKEKENKLTKEQQFEETFPVVRKELIETTFTKYKENLVGKELDIAADWIRSKAFFDKYKNWAAYFRNWIRKAIQEQKITYKSQQFPASYNEGKSYNGGSADPRVQELIGGIGKKIQ